MNWKIPEAFQRPLNFFNSAKNNPETSSNLVNEGEDDLGIEHFQHKGTVSFRRVESAVHNFVDVALPVDLDRLHQHQINIKKCRQMKNFSKLRVEYTNASRTIKQLTRNINEMEILRSRVVEADLYIFDRHLVQAKEKAKDSIRAFLELHGEELNDDGKIQGLHEEDNNFEFLDHNGSNLASGSHDKKHVEDNSVVQLHGNKLVMDTGRNETNEFSTPYYGTSHSYHDSEHNSLDNENPLGEIQTLQLESEDKQAEELWENLRDDIVDLHSVITDLSSIVHQQGEMVDDISSNVEKASKNVKQGNTQLRKATIFKAAMFPVLGAVVGGVVGGPIGAYAGFKLGSITTGIAAAGATGTVIGYQGGKFLKKHQQADAYEMTKLDQEKTDEERKNS